MKKIILLLAFVAVVSGVYAQEPRKSKDYLVMKEGKMLVVKDGKTSVMDKDMTLTDGTKVMPDGKVMMTDGSTKLMKEGETLPMDGKGKSKKKEPAK